MNLSMQIGRAVFALTAVAAVGACAFAQNVLDVEADAQAPNVAHNRLEIATVSAAREAPRWVVSSVRVGAPQTAPQTEPRRVASMHLRAATLPQG